MSRKTGRTDPCPCGSGSKYKRCCLPREEAARLQALEQQELWHSDDDELERELADKDDYSSDPRRDFNSTCGAPGAGEWAVRPSG